MSGEINLKISYPQILCWPETLKACIIPFFIILFIVLSEIFRKSLVSFGVYIFLGLISSIIIQYYSRYQMVSMGVKKYQFQGLLLFAAFFISQEEL